MIMNEFVREACFISPEKRKDEAVNYVSYNLEKHAIPSQGLPPISSASVKANKLDLSQISQFCVAVVTSCFKEIISYFCYC